MTTSVELRMQGEMDHLRLVWQAGESLLCSVPFEEEPEATRYNVLLALQELLTNVLRHGYAGPESPQAADGSEVLVGFEVTEDTFVFEVRDRAPEIDPTRAENVPVHDAAATPSEGGYGILIVNEIMDEFTYRRVDGWNVCRAVKSVRAVAHSGAAAAPALGETRT